MTARTRYTVSLALLLGAAARADRVTIESNYLARET